MSHLTTALMGIGIGVLTTLIALNGLVLWANWDMRAQVQTNTQNLNQVIQLLQRANQQGNGGQ